MILTKLIKKSAMGGIILISLNLLSQPAQALNWNFSYTANNLGGAGFAGTVDAILTTDGTGYNKTTTYYIASISGTANGSSITGLLTTQFPDDTFTPPSNYFNWDGATGIVLDLGGIGIVNSASQVNNIYYDASTGLSNLYNSASGGSFSQENGNVSASSLTPATPVPWETDALSVIGSTVLFGFGLWAKQKFAKPLQK